MLRRLPGTHKGQWKGTLLHLHCAPGLQVWKSIVFNYLPSSRHSPCLLPYTSWNLPPHPPLASQKLLLANEPSRRPECFSLFSLSWSDGGNASDYKCIEFHLYLQTRRTKIKSRNDCQCIKFIAARWHQSNPGSVWRSGTKPRASLSPCPDSLTHLHV